MEHGVFRAWLAEVDDLTDDQRLELEEVLAGRPSRAAVTAVIEASPVAVRSCPTSATGRLSAAARPTDCGPFRCNGCRHELQRADRHAVGPVAEERALLDFGRSMSEGETVVASAERCGVSTAFRWRHRFLTAPAVSPILTGIVEADETFVLRSYKGSRAWERAEQGLPGAEVPDREARGRGGKATKRGLSHEQVPILVAASAAVVSAVRRWTARMPSGPCSTASPAKTPCWLPTVARPWRAVLSG